MICPYCSAANPDDSQICQLCRLRFYDTIDFDKAFDKLTSIGNRVIRRNVPLDHSLLVDEYFAIEEEIQSIMDKAASQIELNFKDIQRLKQETEEFLGDLDPGALSRILDEFDKAQTAVTNGLRTVRETIIKPESFAQIQRGLPDYSAAMAEIGQGLARIETTTLETGDVKTLTKPPGYPSEPDDMTITQQELQRALKAVDAFNETEDIKLIHYIILKTEKIKEILEEFVEDLETEWEEEYQEYEGIHYGASPYLNDEGLEDEEGFSYDGEDEEYHQEAYQYEGQTSEGVDLRLVYTDVENIVSEEEIEELSAPPDPTGYSEIYKDEDWRMIVEEFDKEYDTSLENDYSPAEGETEEDSKGKTIVEGLSSLLVSSHKEDFS